MHAKSQTLFKGTYLPESFLLMKNAILRKNVIKIILSRSAKVIDKIVGANYPDNADGRK